MPRGKKTAMKGRRRVAKTKSKRTYRRRVPRLTYDNLAKCSDMMLFGATRDSSGALVTDTAENYNFNLSQFPRASAIAKEYQEFKLDYVEIRIKPYFDTYNSIVDATSTGTLNRAPQLYKYIMKTGELAPADPNWFRANGVNAISLAKDKNITMRYKPAIRVGNVVSASATPGTGFSTIKVSPWLATNDTTAVGFVPNSSIHYGHAIYIDSQQSAVTNTEVCQIEIEAHFVFRKPNTQTTTPTDPSLVRVNGEVQA